MNTGDNARPVETNQKSRLQAFRPLVLWGLFFIALWGFQTHRRLSQGTKLQFSFFLNGKPPAFSAEVKVDGRPFENGSRIGIGFRTVSVTHPKVVPFSTNIFVWYGERDLGDIALARSKGNLSLGARPRAPIMTIRGPEFSQTFEDFAGTNLTLPSDEYIVEVKYPLWEKRGRVTITSMQPSTVLFQPPFGVVMLDATHSGARYQLRTKEDQIIVSGSFPAELKDIPAGEYLVSSEYRGSRKQGTLTVERGVTNRYEAEFVFGAVAFETTPDGASVLDNSGKSVGKTPLILTDLEPGTWTFHLELDGFEHKVASVDIIARQTNQFRATLLSIAYLSAVNSAERDFGAGQFAQAVEAADQALRANPGDVHAAEVRRKALGFENLRLAKELASLGDPVSAREKLRLAIALLPGNAEVGRLPEEFSKQERALSERKHQDWLDRGRRLFKTILKEYDGSELFEEYHLTIEQPLDSVEKAISVALKTGDPVYSVNNATSSAPKTFVLRARYDMPLFSVKSGYRNVILVGTQTETGGTEIVYRILEYKPNIRGPEGALVPLSGTIVWAPIHSSRIGPLPARLQTQLKEGIADVKGRIQRAVEALGR